MPGRDEGHRRRINIGKLYSMKSTKNMKGTNEIREVYKKVDIFEEDDDEEVGAAGGYYGKFYRKKVKLSVINEAEFLRVLIENKKLLHIMRNIKEIDKDNNGYVTSTELDDIIKLHNHRDLYTKDLRSIIKPFASI